MRADRSRQKRGNPHRLFRESDPEFAFERADQVLRLESLTTRQESFDRTNFLPLRLNSSMSLISCRTRYLCESKRRAHLLSARLGDLGQLFEHLVDRQRFRFEEGPLPLSTPLSDFSQVPDFLVLLLHLCERTSTSLSDRFHEERFTDTELERFVFRCELRDPDAVSVASRKIPTMRWHAYTVDAEVNGSEEILRGSLDHVNEETREVRRDLESFCRRVDLVKRGCESSVRNPRFKTGERGFSTKHGNEPEEVIARTVRQLSTLSVICPSC